MNTFPDISLKSFIAFIAVFFIILFFPVDNIYANSEHELLATPEYRSFIHNTQADSLQLTREKVVGWIKVRIEVAALQNRMKQNADNHDRLVEEFFEKREDLLDSRGWSIEEFDNTEKRIFAAYSAMELADELDESEDDLEKEIAEIRAIEFYTEEQKEELINGLRKMHEQQRKQLIEPTRADWPAVRPYRAEIHHLTAWIAGNRSTPPTLE